MKVEFLESFSSSESDPPASSPPLPSSCERVAITVPLPRAPEPDLCYVRNSSFLSKDIETKTKAEALKTKPESPKKTPSPPVKTTPKSSPPTVKITPKNSPPKKSPPEAISPPKRTVAPKNDVISPPSERSSPPKKEFPLKIESTPKVEVPLRKESPPKVEFSLKKESPPKVEFPLKKESPPPAKIQVASPPPAIAKLNRTNSKEESQSKVAKETPSVIETVVKHEKLSLVSEEVKDSSVSENKVNSVDKKSEESNGVGDKIKKFEKAAEDASANAVGRSSRPGSVRRARSDSREDLPPPATPFKDNVHFDLPDRPSPQPVTLNRNGGPSKWQRSESVEVEKIKPEPQKIIKPEFKPMPSPVDVTIRSPSLGAKIADQFPSRGTAFRNVAAPDTNRTKPAEDANAHNLKACKLKNKKEYSVSKGSSYFTRGPEEIWLVKKKDIEEIEERVLDSFRRAGGNICMRSESMRPASDSGGASGHATTGRKRQAYARSESLDPQWATRAHTLKRQTSAACTCGHDKKTKAKPSDAPPRPRSRSHGDDNAHAHVLDKYETLV